MVVETLAQQAGPLLTQIGIDHGISKQSVHTLVVVSIVYVVTVLVSIVAGAGRVAWTGRLGERLLYELRIRIFSHLQRLSLDYYTDERSGRLMTRMTSDVEALSQLLQDGLVNLAVQGLTMVVVSTALFIIQPDAGPRHAVRRGAGHDRAHAVVPVGLGQGLRAGPRAHRRGARRPVREPRRHPGHHRLQPAPAQHHCATATSSATYRDANVYTARVGAIYGPATDMVGVLGQLVVLAVGGTMVLNDTLTIGGLTAFVLYLTAFFAPIQQLVQLYTTYQSGQAAVTKLRELLATEPSVPERPDAVDLPPIEGRIELRDVGFGYEPGHPVVHDVDLTVEPGETFALVGPTGAGKSTLAKLVVRFYDPTEGDVRIDGHDLRDVTLASLRRQLGVVPQEPFLFVGTIRDNLTFAQPEATDAEMLEACRAVGLDDLLDRLPDGLDTPSTSGELAVVGRAPAPGPGPGLPRPAAGAGARRGDVVPRPEERSARRARPRRGARRAHLDPDRPPPGHRAARRPHRRGRPGRHPRARHP